MTYRKKTWLTLIVVFVAIASFTFLTQKFKDNNEAQAANPWAFDPGYIISDYQMGNYTSMSEADIQAFLTRMNPCNNRDYNEYLTQTSKYGHLGYRWHWENNHFVCLSEERFGNGTTIGTGDTAAHIIWQAAQDYRINPQVLIVLLQKENGLVTDTFPHNNQYRTAAGYGCPDGAACDSQYFGFKNQIRKSAALFREVLDGGWTNYPVGNNLIRYSDKETDVYGNVCGASWVNIRNRATSALYRFTPYQPNTSALAAGYGTGDGCAAYGNRNFYLYFEDWFGGITSNGSLIGSFSGMAVPRIMYVKNGARYVEPNSGNVGNRTFSSFEFFTHLSRKYNNDLCIAIGSDRNCYIFNDLEELNIGTIETMSVPRMMIAKSDITTINVNNNNFGKQVNKGSRIIFDKKVEINGQLYLLERGTSEAVPFDELDELPTPEFAKMDVPRVIYMNGAKIEVVNAVTGITRQIDGDKKAYFTGRSTWDGNLCLRIDDLGENECIDYYKYLKEIDGAYLYSMDVPRYFVINKDVTIYDVQSGKSKRSLSKGWSGFFDKRTDLNNRLCLSSTDMGLDECVFYDDLTEVPSFSPMDVPRDLIISKNSYYTNSLWSNNDEAIKNGQKLYFVDKTYINGELCLRTNSDAQNNKQRCVMYASLKEE